MTDHAESDQTPPIGAVLAGGQGRRIGGQKATVELAGRPLIAYPLGALSAVLSEVAVIAKPTTELPELSGVTVWIEPEEPSHPLVGILEALGHAGGRRVIVCACDMPFVTPALVRALLAADAGGAPAVVASSAGRVQPMLGLYRASALAPLRAAIADDGVRLIDAVMALGPAVHEVTDPDAMFNVNSPDDLLLASAILGRRGRAG